LFKSKLLRIVIIAALVVTIFAPVAQARLMVGSPEKVISNSTLILTGKVIKSNESEEERTFTVSGDRVLKGDYSEPEIVFTAKKNPIYGWTGNIHTLPETNTELLLFLRNDDNDNPYFTFDLNCIAVIEGQQVISLLGGSNVTINDEHWEIEDYVQAYNHFLNSVGPISNQTNPTSIDTNSSQNQDLSARSIAVTASVFWPGIIAFLILLGLSLVGLWYYARSKQSRTSMFWIVGIAACTVVAFLIATFIITPLLLQQDIGTNNSRDDATASKISLLPFNGEVSKVENNLLEIPNNAWVKAKETLSQEHPALQDTIKQLTVSDFMLVEAWQGILSNEHFQLDLYTSSHGNFLLIVSQYGDSEIRINLSPNRQLRPFVFYDENVWLSSLAMGRGASFNIVTGELGPTVTSMIGDAYPEFGDFNPFEYLYSKLDLSSLEDLGQRIIGKTTAVDGVNLMFVDVRVVVVTQGQIVTPGEPIKGLPKWLIVSRAYRTQGVVTEIEIESDTLRSLTLKGTRKVKMSNNPIDYDYTGKMLHIKFEDASLKRSDYLKKQLKEGAEIIITFWQAAPPDGKVVEASDLDYIYIVKDGRYYDWKGNEITLSEIESSGK